MASNPNTFELTREEAINVQALQFARQTRFARQGRNLRLAAIAVGVIGIGALFAVDWLVFAHRMPFWAFVGFPLAFFAGILVQSRVVQISANETRMRLLEETGQVWESRTIEIRPEGLRQVTPSADCVYAWSALGPVESESQFLLIWLGRLSVIVIPSRAFDTEAEMNAFEAELRASAGYSTP